MREQVQGQAPKPLWAVSRLLWRLCCVLLCRALGQVPGGRGEYMGGCVSGFLDLLGACLYREPMKGDGGGSSQMATARSPGLLQTWVLAGVGPEKGAGLSGWQAGQETEGEQGIS